MERMEEKAKEYSQEFGSSELQEVSYNSFMCGADTQKKIDEESFYPIIEESVLKAIEKQKKTYIEKACEWWINYLAYPTDTDVERAMQKEMVEDFRKAMEECI